LTSEEFGRCCYIRGVRGAQSQKDGFQEKKKEKKEEEKKVQKVITLHACRGPIIIIFFMFSLFPTRLEPYSNFLAISIFSKNRTPRLGS
jgi:hypothetical protein